MTIASLAPLPLRPDPVHRQECLDQAARCRRIAQFLSDREASNSLLSMACDYERRAWRTT